MSESETKIAKKKGLQRLAPELRAKLANGSTGLATLFLLLGLIMPAKLDGVWLRIPVLLALLLTLAAGWFVVRRKKTGVVISNGLIVGIMGLSVLAMALHKASGYVSLAGLLCIAAAFLLKTCVENPFVRGRDIQNEGEKSSFGWLFENVESLAAALVVVLLVWHFALEAFQIPTGSMSPTLLGKQSLDLGMLTDGERVLVDKLAFEIRDPKQFEPVVFRYPLLRTSPYVKRCVGIPGNEILIVRGDVYIRQHEGAKITLLEKPEVQREVLWLPMLEEVGSRSAFIKNFGREGDVEFEDGAISIGKKGRVVFPKGDGDEAAEVMDHDASFGANQTPEENYNRGVCNDLRIVGEVEIEDGGKFVVSIVRDDDTFEFSIGPDGEPELKRVRDGESKNLTTDEMKDFDSSAPFDIDFSIADGRLKLLVDGDELANLPVVTPLLAALRNRDKESKFNLAGDIGMKLAKETTVEKRRARIYLSGESTFTLESLQRDIYYQGRFFGSDHELPFAVKLEEDQYFVLGDNSPGSADCRAWTQVEIWMNDGSQYVGSLNQITQPTLAKWLHQSGAKNGQSALQKLISVAHYSQEERGIDALSDTVLVNQALEDLQAYLKDKNRLTLPFFNTSGGKETIDAANIKRIQVRPMPYVKRELFAGRPFAVFLSPRGLKLID